MFEYSRKVNVYETDLMGIVHHSNYLRFCEEARVSWCKKNGVLLNKKSDDLHSVFGLTVYETRVKHVLPLRYDDLFKINIQTKAVGAKIIFQYKMTLENKIVCLAETVHCSLGADFKVRRLDKDLIEIAEKEKWIETWL